MNYKLIFLGFWALLISGCVSRTPPSNVNNACALFKQHPSWLRDAKDVERRWKIPVPIQLSIIYHESRFNARARPARSLLLHTIPWKRPSSAYGYTQALASTWDEYKKHNGGLFTSRADFGDGLDFIGWYANEANKKAGIPRSDAYSLYLAYHEGIGGYQHKTYIHKSWLISLARRVKAKSELYAYQMRSCHV